MPESVLVTGAGGFVGRAVVAALEESGRRVIAVTRRNGHASTDATEAICDLSSRREVAAFFEAHKPASLIHLAWHMAPGNATALENYDWIGYSIDVLRAFARAGGRRAVLVGSCMEYDWRRPGTYSEEGSSLDSQFEYGIAKAALYWLFGQFCRSAGLSGAWARPFFMYGPGENPRRLVAAVVNDLLAGREAACTQVRDFMHVDDVAAAIVAIHDSSFEGAVNVASGQPVTIRDLVDEIGQQLNAMELLNYGARPMPAHEPIEVSADVSRLRDIIGFTPRHDLASGIAQTIEAWKAERVAEGSQT
jgi:nucleoside-diphosphate-sugar epimerase